ncbi:MAG: capsule biosynthesis protein CapA [Sediminimonas qiaohouensis]|uniref:Capsule biosynthesis protein CapA n=1 Tax=Sediminimonas qiaohouensis TaxID=552061 RepID=A0A7C9LML4_9RHOB|nr:capsule biosynthesis protein CapA [Sediminimonas qiaohouensis]MTJ04040.1 capsule biosynthesis protein CapA [Sediminimonas qiaohouensis]
MTDHGAPQAPPAPGTQQRADPRVFVFLQGPHGPFFSQLGTMLRRTGAQVWRIGFNAGDRAFWPHAASYIPFRGHAADWPDTLSALLDDKGATDIVLYGDTRTIHSQAIGIALDRGLRVHVYEEGYLRPYWISYERGGANGHSRLMHTSVDEMRTTLDHSDAETPAAPARWGDMRQHIFYGALYHWFVMCANRGYRNFKPHRDLSVTREFRLYLRRLLSMPFLAAERRLTTLRIRMGRFPYHVALLQLEHDASFRVHSPFSSMTEFLDQVIGEFARGAPAHHHLVIKAHPLEDGRVNLRREVARLSARADVAGRVHFLLGGKLAQLLDEARSAVTVNSTAAQQVLWRGLPLKAYGDAVYAKPEFISDQPLAAFFAGAKRPDRRAYDVYRRYLLETSQVPGGYYSARGRRQLLRHVVDMMLSDEDPYEALASGNAAPRQQLRLVR